MLIISNISTDQTTINKMPKVLYLNIDFHPTVRFRTGKSVNNDSV